MSADWKSVFRRPVIPSEAACQAAALCEGWKESRYVSLWFHHGMSPTSIDMTKDSDQTNPLREGLSTRAVPQPCAIVIFGATGDLTHRKLIPALYNLAAAGELPPAVTVVGFARRPKSDDEFRDELAETTKQFSRQQVRDEIWKTFAQSLFYHQSEFDDEEGYESLAKRLDQVDQGRGTRAIRLFYFAAAPEQFQPILKNL